MRLKLWLRYPVDIRRARRLLEYRDVLEQGSGEAWKSTERPVVLDLRTPQMMFDGGRHFQSIAYYAWRAGSPTILRCSNLLLGGVARKVFGREMLAQPYVQRISPGHPLPMNSLVLADYEPGDSARSSYLASGVTFLRMRIGRDVDRSDPVMPYPMHPATLRYLSTTDLASMRANDHQREAVLFAGCQKPRYGDGWMQREFGILSRLEILNELRYRFPDRVRDSWSGAGGDRRPIVLLDSRTCTIQPSEWLPSLASARFFLCCPGGRQPLCHNLIEAMSVGTIPIIEYGDRITPALVDGQQAICFRGRDGIGAAIERIDSMSEEEVRGLSRRVASFYDRHLCGVGFLRDLRDGSVKSETGRLCMPFHERNFFTDPSSIAA